MNYIELPLFNSPYYRYSIALENQTYELTFTWTTRRQGWILDIMEQDSTPVILGHKLQQQFPMLADIPMQNQGLSGYFLLLPNSSVTKTLNTKINALASNYKLFYIY